MAKRCKDCKGRGRWQEQVENEGLVEYIWFECNTCHGSGITQDPEEADAYDIGGDSYADDN